MPMPLDGGRDLAMIVNSVTGRCDFDWDSTGNPSFDDSDSHIVLSLLLEEQDGYPDDPTGKRGSLLHTVREDKTGTDTALVAYARSALQPALDDGRIRELVEVSAKRFRLGVYQLTVRYRNRSGHLENILLPIGD